MKKIILSLTSLLIILSVFAQAPEKMNYQAVARDLSGLPLVSTTVNLEFDILEGSAIGVAVYSEIQSKTTNQFGLFTAEIGGGTVVSGAFSAIDWGVSAYYLRITVNGDVMRATQLLSVPYALYSKTSGGTGAALVAGSGIDITGGVITATDTSIINELQVMSISNDTIFLSDGGFVQLPAAAGDNWGTETVSVSGTNITGDGTVGNPLIVTDNDNSLTNELQVLSISNDTIFLSDGGFVKLPAAAGDNWGTETVSVSGTNITGDGTVGNPLIVTDNDNSLTNELQVMSISNDTIFLSDGGFVQLPAATGDDWGMDTVVSFGVNIVGQGTTLSPLMVLDNDTSLTNELQDLSWNNTDSNVIDISNGTSISLASNPPTANQVLTWDGGKWIAQTLTTEAWTKTGANIYPTVLTDNVGIGTANPQQLLTLSNLASTTLRLERANTAAFDWEMNVDNLGFHLKGGADGTAGTLTDFVNVDGNGRVGLGTTTPTQQLDVTGTAEIDSLRINNSYAFPTVDAANYGEVLTSDAAGNVTWQAAGGGGASLMQDADGDTEINVEEITDEDIIHFRLGDNGGYAANEYFTMKGPRLEVLNSGNSVFIGENAGAADDLSTRNNSFIGFNAGASNTSGANGVALGANALESNTTGNWNLAIGYFALRDNITGNQNIAIGGHTLDANLTGSNNVAIGQGVMTDNISGSSNIAVGASSLNNNTSGHNNVAVGNSSMRENETGFQNAAVGSGALFENIYGSQNVAMGLFTMRDNTAGISNVAFGAYALRLNTVANNNTAIGDSTLYKTGGSFNTGLGKNAGLTNIAGTNNTFLGDNADAGAGFTNLTNATAIGSGAKVNTSNSLILGNNANVGIGTSAPTTTLDVIGITKTDSLIVTTNSGTSGDILTNDGTGNAIWQASSLGTFSTTSNVTSNSSGDLTADDFVFGSPQLDYTGTINEGYRVLFDKSNGAFRAGAAFTTAWDAPNRGNFSTGFGRLTIASGQYSFAEGNLASATADGAISMGVSTTASGFNSIALGNNSTASGDNSIAIGTNVNGYSYQETVFGYNSIIYSPGSTNSQVLTDRLFVVGNGATTAARSNALTILKNGNVGIGTSAPTRKLQVNDNSFNPAGYFQQTGAGPGLTVYSNTNLSTQTVFYASSLGGGAVGFNIMGDGNVGIGTSAPSEKLDVDGNVKVTGNYGYAAPQTRYLSVDVMSFNQGNNTDGLYNNDIFGKELYYPTSTIDKYIFAPVNLPEGAIVTEIRMYYTDGSAETITASMRRLELAANNDLTAGPTVTSVNGLSASTGTGGHTVNNQDYSYRVRVHFSGGSGTSLMLENVRITYTITNAD